MVQRTFCYCPKCNNELVKNGEFIEDERDTVTYRCSKCWFVSEWDFDPPTPLLLTPYDRNSH